MRYLEDQGFRLEGRMPDGGERAGAFTGWMLVLFWLVHRTRPRAASLPAPATLQLLAFFNAKLAAQTLDAMKLSQICTILKIPSASCPNNTISQLTLIS